jgi:hypothetical protein
MDEAEKARLMKELEGGVNDVDEASLSKLQVSR